MGNVIEFIKLSEIFGLVSKPKFVLGTTYTLSLAFFESVIFPDIQRSHLKSCLILCDAIGHHHALSEAAALQGAAQDYMVVAAPVPGAFHSKVWLIIGEGEAVLLVGSGNLTQAGFMTNAEMFDALHFTLQAPPTPAMAASVRAFLMGLAGMWPAQDGQHLLCVETLSKMEYAFADLGASRNGDLQETRFIHSFNGPLIEQMPKEPEASDLYIAAPFFGGNIQGLAAVSSRYSSAKIHLFPAVHGGNSTDIPLSKVISTYPKASVSPLAVPQKKNAFPHLKLYGVVKNKDSAWLYCTSANCTDAAWRGTNVEAGLLRSVPRSLLSKYFTASSNKLPAAALKIDYQVDVTSVLPCWASDTGAGLDIVVAHNSRNRLPLKEVTLTIRSGSNLAICHKPVLFHEGVVVHLPWTAFAGWQRRRKIAHCLEICARDVTGKNVHAACLVENKLLLSADPIHRSAFRGALALLDAEGAPELADVAAIFTLARDVFEGHAAKVSEPKRPDSSTSQPENENQPVSIAVWPPQPDTTELRKRIGAGAFGHLQWFQKILKIFLSNEPSDDENDHFESNLAAHGDDDQESVAEVCRDEALDGAIKKAQRIWVSAYKDYTRLRDKLTHLCPTTENAPNIWAAALFALLSTLAVYRAVKRMAPDLPLGVTCDALCDDFLRAMFNERRQPDDFCCPKSLRYRSEKFPALSHDLYCTFKLRPHQDIANVILALLINRRVRVPETSLPIFQKHQINMIYPPGLVPDQHVFDTCVRVWRRYMCTDSANPPEAAFEANFKIITQCLSGVTP